MAGFGSGHLRLFSLPSGRLLAEIAAHNGWITGLADAEFLDLDLPTPVSHLQLLPALS